MKKVLVVVGPTAVGKTKTAIELAKHYNAEIISGDSVAIYKRLDIGSAKPTKEEMDGVKHYLIDIIDPATEYSVKDFQEAARKIIDSSDDLKIISGGTGLYVQSVLYNYEFNASKRDFDYEEKYKDYSNDELYSLLLELDSNVDKNKIHPNNRKRVLRAIEVKQELNQSIHSFNKKNEKVYDYFIVYLSMERNRLYERIEKRVDMMFDEGLLAEVKSLYDDKIYPHAIGYKELLPYFDGLITLDTAKDEIKKNTRHLAKRQETWFKNQMDTHFYDAREDKHDEMLKQIISDIDRWLES